MNLQNSTCVVTGATEGIGRAIALSLGSRGARLAVCARSAGTVEALVDELRARGVTAVGRPCDVASEPAVAGFAKLVKAEFGPPDVLVNNAGLAHFVSVEKMTPAQFDETMGVNVRGVFLMTRAFLPEMRQRGSGHIINIASLAGRNPVPGGAAYAASKHAVLGFSKSLFGEVRQDGIRVVAICPGSVVTPFFDKSGAGLQHAERKLQPEDVADAVVATLELPDRALISELDIRPTNP
ncbi:MAG: SDR family NAD(P)-dependent oxidoreductase [Gemmatimonadota bacterium]|nr:MAG: SDR family NAD(P)-dependent oxidoreductase [Gemmatimonadota bacterium]